MGKVINIFFFLHNRTQPWRDETQKQPTFQYYGRQFRCPEFFFLILNSFFFFCSLEFQKIPFFRFVEFIAGTLFYFALILRINTIISNVHSFLFKKWIWIDLNLVFLVFFSLILGSYWEIENIFWNIGFLFIEVSFCQEVCQKVEYFFEFLSVFETISISFRAGLVCENDFIRRNFRETFNTPEFTSQMSKHLSHSK